MCGLVPGVTGSDAPLSSSVHDSKTREDVKVVFFCSQKAPGTCRVEVDPVTSGCPTAGDPDVNCQRKQQTCWSSAPCKDCSLGLRLLPPSPPPPGFSSPGGLGGSCF